VTKALANPNGTDGLGTHDFSPAVPASKAAARTPSNWVPFVANPLDGYPIVGYTTLELASCYQDSAVGAYIKAFLTQFYSLNNNRNLSLEGFAAVPAATKTAILQVFIKGTSKYAINIGNPALCAASGKTTTLAPGL
jgi:hypothetical protein